MAQINISINVICFLISIIILLTMFWQGQKKDRLNTLFISLLFCHIPLLLVDAAIFVLEGNSSLLARLTFRWAYFLSFLLGAILLILFSLYIKTFAEGRDVESKISAYFCVAAVAVCCINILFVVLTQLNAMYYIIDENNHYIRQSWYWLSQLLAFACILLNACIIVKHRKGLRKYELIFLMSYVALPLLALLIQNMIPGIAAIDLATTLGIFIYYVGIQSEQTTLLKQKELELTQSRIAVMLSQIQPHFLYNSLATISCLCDKDPVQAKKSITEFSAYLRANMESLEEKEPILIEKELRHVEVFLNLEKAMYGKALTVIYDIRTMGFCLPVLTLQPIVENAIRHGIGKREGGGSVTISTKETEDEYLIVVSDDGMGFDCEKTLEKGERHIGINNVRQRLYEQSEGSIEIESQTGIGTVVTIKIPKHKRKAGILAL